MLNLANSPARQAIIRLVELENLFWGIQFWFDDGEIAWVDQVFPSRADAKQAVDAWIKAVGGKVETVH